MKTNHSHIFRRYKSRLCLTEAALHRCPLIYHRLFTFTYLGSAALSLLFLSKLHLNSGHPHICIDIRELYCRSHQQIPWGQAAWHKPSIPLMPTQLAEATHRKKVSRTEVLSAPRSRDSLFSVRKTFLPQVFRICGPHTTQSPTDPTQISKSAPRWPKHLLWPFIHNFWCKTFLKRGRKNPRGKSVCFQGKPDKWYTCK